MAYIINKTDGSFLNIVNDLETDTTSTSITLIGKGFKNWGEAVNENFVKILENFANSTPPLNPLNGQLWYDTNDKILKIYDSTTSSWISLLKTKASFYVQKIVSPVSGNITGFINDNKIVGLFSDISASNSILDNGSLFPSVNAQTEFTNGLSPGLTLSNNLSNIFGTTNLNLGVMNTTNTLEVVKINSVGKVNFLYDIQVNQQAEFKNILVSGNELSKYYLPISAGTNNQILTTRGDGNVSVWTSAEKFFILDRIIGYDLTSDLTLINASAPSKGIEFFTNNKLRLIIDQNGRLGLDSSAPSYKFEMSTDDNTSSVDIKIGLINDNASLETGLDINTYYPAGSAGYIKFIRGNTNQTTTILNELLGSITWNGIDTNNIKRESCKIEVRSTDIGSNNVISNLDFLISDNSGNLQKTITLTSSRRVLIYDPENIGNFYALPTSAGTNKGYYIASKPANSQLSWEPIPNYEVLVSSYDLSLLTPFNYELKISAVPTESLYVVYVSAMKFTGSLTTPSYNINGNKNSSPSFMHVASGISTIISAGSGYEVSASNMNPGLGNLKPNNGYFGKVYLEILNNGTKLRGNGQFILNNNKQKLIFNVGTSASPTPFDNIIIRHPYPGSLSGKAKVYRILNYVSPSVFF